MAKISQSVVLTNKQLSGRYGCRIDLCLLGGKTPRLPDLLAIKCCDRVCWTNGFTEVNDVFRIDCLPCGDAGGNLRLPQYARFIELLARVRQHQRRRRVTRARHVFPSLGYAFREAATPSLPEVPLQYQRRCYERLGVFFRLIRAAVELKPKVSA